MTIPPRAPCDVTLSHTMAQTASASKDTPTFPPMLVIAMGVSGTGKSTLGKALSSALCIPFIDGDDLHPPSNVAKMSLGSPLDDADREPWLHLIRQTADSNPFGVVIACSSLKRAYREILRGSGTPPTYFIYIKGEKDLMVERMKARTGHFMKVEMLDSQLATLESPEGEDGVVAVPLANGTEDQVRKAVEGIKKIVARKAQD